MSVDCPQCGELRQIAIEASKAYHKFLFDLEAAYICNNSEVAESLSARLEATYRSRNVAIDEWTSHKNTHAREKSAERLRFSKGLSA